MTVKEFATISMAIKAAYPGANLMPDDKSKEVWYTMLSDLEYTICMAAIKEIISNNKYAPSISEIRAKCMAYTELPIVDWGEAWEGVMRAIRRYGYMQEPEALGTLDETTRKCVKRIGYQNICMSENITADRANFRMIYEQEENRVRQNNQLPAMLRNQKQQRIEQLIDSTIQQIEKKEEPVPETKDADMDHISEMIKKLRRN